LPALLQTPIAAKPLLRAVKKLLLNRYHKILAMSAAIHSLTPDEDVHEVRIEFKKLRYLIEFFICLLPPKRISKFIGDVKKIQTVLGDFNDYCIQIEFLSSYADDSQIEMSKAISGLIAVLHQKKIAERQKVDAALTNFFTLATTNDVEFLFGATTAGVSK
jgi:CHAD domain-containing protein